MTKHTAGEWMLGKQDRPIGYFPIYARIGVTKLACICKTDAHEIGFGISEAEHKANARLIAAAPELLEALKWLNVEFECRDDDFGGVLFTRNDFERVRKAIAKAEGVKEADHE